MTALQAAFALSLLFAAASAADDGPTDLLLKTVTSQGGYATVNVSWTPGSCANADTTYTLLVSGPGPDADLNITTKETVSQCRLEFFTDYEFSLRATPECPRVLNDTKNIGPGAPHPVKNFSATATGENLMLVVTEAYMPKTVGYYRVNVSSLLKTKDRIFGRDASDVHEGIWQKTFPNVVLPNMSYTVSVEPMIFNDVEYYGDATDFNFTSPKREFPLPSNLTVTVDADDQKNVRADIEWDFDTSTPDFISFNVTYGKANEEAAETLNTNGKKQGLESLEYLQSYTVKVEALFKIAGVEIAGSEATTTFDARGSLRAPYGMQVAELNTSYILVGWKFDPPAGAGVGNPSYRVDYRPDNGESYSETVASSPALLRNLERSTNYTVTVTATLTNYEDGVSEPFKFKTREQDWPPATFKSAAVLSRDEPDKASYVLAWDTPEIRSVDSFEVQICVSDNCEKITPRLNEQHQQYNIAYDQEYNVTVKTVYKLPLEQTVATLSETYKGIATVGVPGPVQSLNVAQTLNVLTLVWNPPKETRGPVSYYKISAWDSVDSTSSNTVNVSVPAVTTQIKLPHLSMNSYELSVVAVAVDRTTQKTFAIENPERVYRDLILLDAPKEVKMTGREQNSLKLQVTPISDLAGIEYKAVWPANKEGTFAAKDLVVDKLRPYELVDVQVSSCFRDVSNVACCGSALNITGLRSNVGGPSAASNLSAQVQDDFSIILEWERPSDARGPLNGYYVELFKADNRAASQQKLTLEPAENSHQFTKTEKNTLYNITITAYNNDLETGKAVLGEVASLTVQTHGTAGWVVPVVVLVLLFAAAGFAGGFYYYRKKRSAPGTSMAAFSFFNNNNNN